jgi:hypothetical protein
MRKGDFEDSGIEEKCGRGIFEWPLRGEISKVEIEGEE